MHRRTIYARHIATSETTLQSKAERLIRMLLDIGIEPCFEYEQLLDAATDNDAPAFDSAIVDLKDALKVYNVQLNWL